MVKPILDSEEAAKKLMQEAYQRGSADNITCVVVRFLENCGRSDSSSQASGKHTDSSKKPTGGQGDFSKQISDKQGDPSKVSK